MGETTVKAPGAEGEELEITELVEFEPTRLDGVKAAATGIPFLIMKSAVRADGDGSDDGDDAATPTADHAATALVRAVVKAVVDGQVDQGPDIAISEQLLHLIGQAIINEAQEFSAGQYDELWDVGLLTDAGRSLLCWQRHEQNPPDGDMDGVVMDSAAAQELFKAEEAIYKRNVSTAERKTLASQGQALEDGSYPIKTAEDLGNAATLARSKHGNWQAARRLIARMARKLGVKNPLDDDKDDDGDGKSSKSTVAEGETSVQTDAQVDDGQIAKAVEDAVTKAVAPLKERIETLSGELAKVKATPVPGGLVLSANARPQGGAAVSEDWAVKAAYYEHMAATVAAPSDADNYRKLAAQARAQAPA